MQVGQLANYALLDPTPHHQVLFNNNCYWAILKHQNEIQLWSTCTYWPLRLLLKIQNAAISIAAQWPVATKLDHLTKIYRDENTITENNYGHF